MATIYTSKMLSIMVKREQTLLLYMYIERGAIVLQSWIISFIAS